jgi:hypothetical protein
MKRLLTSVLLAVCAYGQMTVSPTPQQAGIARGEDVSGYNVVNSFELGYRFHSVGGNLGKYRSDVNFGNGVRLLGSTLTVNSKEGHGARFDEIVLTTQGLGNDPYQSANLRVQKNRLYRYDLLWRLNDYYNPALPVGVGAHLMNTTRRMQDHNITLFPQSGFRIFAGYSRNSQSGPALSTVQLFDSRGAEFPLFSDIRRKQDEYRLGGEFSLFGSKITWLKTWEYFKDDTPYSLTNPVTNVDGANTLTSFSRVEPYHGRAPGWRVGLLRDKKWYAANARFTYTGGERSFIQDERAIGTDRLASARNRQVLLFGSGRRPVTTANLNLSLFPNDRITISNHSAYHQTRMEGDGSYRELNNATLDLELVNFQFLGIRTFTNLTDINYRPTKKLGLYGGYNVSQRRIRSTERTDFAGLADTISAQQSNTIHAGLAGLRIRLANPLTLTLDSEIGRANRPIYPISERNYHALGARIQYKAKSLLISAFAKTNYNTNSVSLAYHSMRGRTYAADFSWVPAAWFAVDAGYSRQHLDTNSALAYFAAARLVTDRRSVYTSNIHSGNLGVRFGIRGRADLFVGYSRVQDAGADDQTIRSGVIDPAQPFDAALIAASTFPLTFESPLARLSVRLRENLRFNVGYQHYRYREDFLLRFGQDYRAHTGFTSVSWSF